MKICVVTLFTEEIEKESKLSTLNKKKYCEKYNIDYRFFYGRASERHAQWDKIQCVLQTLPEYDYVVWMDSDTVFNNFDISLLDLINDNINFDSLFCSDVCYTEGVNHLMVNTGVMLFKNSEWSFELLSKVWNSINDYSLTKLNKHSYEGFPHEQGKICEILLNEDTSKYKIFPQSKFNTHPNMANDSTFVIHYMGSRQSEKHLSDFINSVKKINTKLNIDENENFETIKLKKLKICVISHYTENLQNVANITLPNKDLYVKKHGYDFKYYKGRLSNRHPGWDKIKLLKEIATNSDYDYLVWMDNDTYITNTDLRLDFICNTNHNKNLIIASEDTHREIKNLDPSFDYNQLHNLRIVNTGVMIFKNNEWFINFLDEVWNTKSNTNKGFEFSHKEIIDNKFNYDYWPFEQGPIHLVLSKSNKEYYKIVNSDLINKFKTSHKKQNFICHFVGEGSNDFAIKNYVDGLNKDNEKNLVKNIVVDVPFKNKKAKLELNIYKTDNNFLLKYIWDYSDIKIDHLSHSFQIVEGESKKQIDFASNKMGSFQISNLENKKIYHSYDWFGEYEWSQII